VPNTAVDVNSRAVPACYPRGTFYPLSDGPSTRSRRITRPGFRLCSACRPHSQAPFCPCTQRTVAVRAEGTFGRLRYLSGGNRPSQTAHQALSLSRIHGSRLEPRHIKGGISLAPPRRLAPPLHRLPPILHMMCQDTTPGCSKGPRGLSVLPRVGGIFTTTTTSPSPPLRHRPSRYTIRAGRNLPDKEFRYLRTVLSSSLFNELISHREPHVAMGVGPYHHPRTDGSSPLRGSCSRGAWRMASEDPLRMLSSISPPAYLLFPPSFILFLIATSFSIPCGVRCSPLEMIRYAFTKS